MVWRCVAADTSTLTRKGRIRNLAERLGWKFSRVKHIGYQEAGHVHEAEVKQLRRHAAALELQDSINRIVMLRDRLQVIDPDFHHATIALLDAALREMERK